MKNNRITVILLIIILLLIGGGAWYINSLKQDLSEANMTIRKEVLKNDELKKINETQYRKLVADTLKQKELNDIVDSLKIKLDAKPKIVYRTKIVIKEVEKPTDSVEITEDTVKVDSYYPKKENYFVRYENLISLIDSTGTEKWSFNPVDISIVLSQRDDGIWQSDIKVPEFMEVGEVDVRATPLELPKIDNFGVIFGAGYGKDFKDGGIDYLRFSGGLRFKKFYIDVGGGTNQTIDGSIKVEF